MKLTHKDLVRLRQGNSKNTASFMTWFSGSETLDWNNIGGLLWQRTQESITGAWSKYSWPELGIRAGIILAAIGGAYVGYQAGDRLDSANLLLKTSTTLLGAGLAGYVAHKPALKATQARRQKLVDSRTQYMNDIQQLLKLKFTETSFVSSKAQIKLFISCVNQKIVDVIDCPLPTQKRGDAAINLILRRNMMEALLEKVTAQLASLTEDNALIKLQAFIEDWQQSLDCILTKMIEDLPRAEIRTDAVPAM